MLHTAFTLVFDILSDFPLDHELGEYLHDNLILGTFNLGVYKNNDWWCATYYAAIKEYIEVFNALNHA